MFKSAIFKLSLFCAVAAASLCSSNPARATETLSLNATVDDNDGEHITIGFAGCGFHETLGVSDTVNIYVYDVTAGIYNYVEQLQAGQEGERGKFCAGSLSGTVVVDETTHVLEIWANDITSGQSVYSNAVN